MKVFLETYTGKEFEITNNIYTNSLDKTQSGLLGKIASRSRAIENVNKDGIFKSNKENEKLFKQTIEWKHESIQEFVDFIFDIRDLARVSLAQLTRHRIASYNCMSGRHLEPEKMRMPNDLVQSSGEIIYKNGFQVDWIAFESGDMTFTYRQKLKNGTWKIMTLKEFPYELEDIRYGFPEGSCINMYCKFNGRSLRNFFKLRLDKHAQWEIKELACQMFDLVYKINPTLLEDLLYYRISNNDIIEFTQEISEEGNKVLELDLDMLYDSFPCSKFDIGGLGHSIMIRNYNKQIFLDEMCKKYRKSLEECLEENDEWND